MTTIKNLTTGETITREFTEAQLSECKRDGFTVIQNFEVIEDNGGGLHLFVLDADGKVTWGGANYEYCGDALKEAVDLLMGGATPESEGWEANFESLFGVTAQDAYDEFTEEGRRNGGWELIADQFGIYPDRMGYNAMEAFGIEIE